MYLTKYLVRSTNFRMVSHGIFLLNDALLALHSVLMQVSALTTKENAEGGRRKGNGMFQVATLDAYGPDTIVAFGYMRICHGCNAIDDARLSPNV